MSKNKIKYYSDLTAAQRHLVDVLFNSSNKMNYDVLSLGEKFNEQKSGKRDINDYLATSFIYAIAEAQIRLLGFAGEEFEKCVHYQAQKMVIELRRDGFQVQRDDLIEISDVAKNKFEQSQELLMSIIQKAFQNNWENFSYYLLDKIKYLLQEGYDKERVARTHKNIVSAVFYNYLASSNKYIDTSFSEILGFWKKDLNPKKVQKFFNTQNPPNSKPYWDMMEKWAKEKDKEVPKEFNLEFAIVATAIITICASAIIIPLGQFEIVPLSWLAVPGSLAVLASSYYSGFYGATFPDKIINSSRAKIQEINREFILDQNIFCDKTYAVDKKDAGLADIRPVLMAVHRQEKDSKSSEHKGEKLKTKSAVPNLDQFEVLESSRTSSFAIPIHGQSMRIVKMAGTHNMYIGILKEDQQKLSAVGKNLVDEILQDAPAGDLTIGPKSRIAINPGEPAKVRESGKYKNRIPINIYKLDEEAAKSCSLQGPCTVMQITGEELNHTQFDRLKYRQPEVYDIAVHRAESPSKPGAAAASGSAKALSSDGNAVGAKKR